jgi:hypothetical protein
VTTQRAWRSTCPQCGAPVELRSAATPVAVCGFCKSTLARDGESLRRMGAAAEVFEDYSPLQLGATGRFDDLPFTVIGRLQWRTADAAWNEWHVLFEDGEDAPGGEGDQGRRSGGATPSQPGGAPAHTQQRPAYAWLSEDNGRYVVAVDGTPPDGVPHVDNAESAAAILRAWQPGQSYTIAGRPWSVASVAVARVAAAQGELPRVPRIDEPVVVVELRNPAGQVATIAAGARSGVTWSVGTRVELAALALQGLRDISTGTAATRGAECPSCGAALSIKLDTTKSIACHQCKAVVDVSQGVGGDLGFRQQAALRTRSAEPWIALGSTCKVALDGAPATWQVVGYQVRQTIEDDDRSTWIEYLLYSHGVGFAFLVDASEGWSYAVPITGVPTVAGLRARWQGRDYMQREAYKSKTIYVLGEFYWSVQRDQITHHIDYASASYRLNRELQGEPGSQEVTWSVGRALRAADIASAFGLAPMPRTATGDVQPIGNWMIILFIVVTLLIMMALLDSCDRDRCDSQRARFGESSLEYRQCLQGSGGARSGGGSWGSGGGWGGGHK